jgi:mono/diheme cytochrome c family protein
MRPVAGALAVVVALFHVGEAFAQGKAEPGKALWESADARCRDCHGNQGEGGFGPDLAGRQLTIDQFIQAVRKPWGIMPSFTEQQISNEQLGNVLAYFTSLPKVAQPAAWKVPLPSQAKQGEVFLTGAYGCTQCHGATFAGPRAGAGAVAADFDWFKRLVYEHTENQNAHRASVGAAPAGIRMGNYSRMRLPESILEQMFAFMRDDLKFRPAVAARLTAGATPGTYSLAVENTGIAGKGLAAESLTISLALAPGTSVSGTTGAGYQGVRKDADGKTDVAVWQLARLGPKDKQAYTITLTGGAIPRGSVSWTRPAQGGGTPDNVPVVVPPPPPQTR